MKPTSTKLALLALAILISPANVFGQESKAKPQDATQTDTPAEAFKLPATDDGLAGAGTIRRANWFQNVWRKRRQAFLDNQDQHNGGIVFLGDSITQGWSDNFRDDFADANVSVANRGISGDTTRGMLLRLKEDVLSLSPSTVVMLMGTNDLEERDDPTTIAGNVELIVDAIKANDAKTHIVLCQVFPSSSTKSRPASEIKELNRLYQALAKNDPAITVVDTWTLFANDKGDAKKEEFPDLLHPNHLGYAKWKAAIRPVFATLGLTETDSDDFEIESGYRSLFNGTDLSGWGYRPTSEKMIRGRNRWLNNNPNAPAWPIVKKAVNFDNKASSPDGRYRAINGRLVVTTPPEGRKIQQLWTTEEFSGNMTLKLEFRATPNADSGVFLREPQLQCRDFVLAGPYKDLKEYRPQDWNELVVVIRDGKAHCTCNGEVIEEAFNVPESGPIGLEGDRGQMEYRRIRVKQD